MDTRVPDLCSQSSRIVGNVSDRFFDQEEKAYISFSADFSLSSTSVLQECKAKSAEHSFKLDTPARHVMSEIIALQRHLSRSSSRFKVTLNKRTKTSEKFPDYDNKHVPCLDDVNKL